MFKCCQIFLLLFVLQISSLSVVLNVSNTVWNGNHINMFDGDDGEYMTLVRDAKSLKTAVWFDQKIDRSLDFMIEMSGTTSSPVVGDGFAMAISGENLDYIGLDGSRLGFIDDGIGIGFGLSFWVEEYFISYFNGTSVLNVPYAPAGGAFTASMSYSGGNITVNLYGSEVLHEQLDLSFLPELVFLGVTASTGGGTPFNIRTKVIIHCNETSGIDDGTELTESLVVSNSELIVPTLDETTAIDLLSTTDFIYSTTTQEETITTDDPVITSDLMSTTDLIMSTTTQEETITTDDPVITSDLMSTTTQEETIISVDYPDVITNPMSSTTTLTIELLTSTYETTSAIYEENVCDIHSCDENQNLAIEGIIIDKTSQINGINVGTITLDGVKFTVVDTMEISQTLNINKGTSLVIGGNLTFSSTSITRIDPSGTQITVAGCVNFGGELILDSIPTEELLIIYGCHTGTFTSVSVAGCTNEAEVTYRNDGLSVVFGTCEVEKPIPIYVYLIIIGTAVSLIAASVILIMFNQSLRKVVFPWTRKKQNVNVVNNEVQEKIHKLDTATAEVKQSVDRLNKIMDEREGIN